MSITRPPSSEEGKRRSHGINIGSAYMWALNARYAAVFKGMLPDEDALNYYQHTLDKHTPPLPAMARKHSIISRQIRRWRQASRAQGQKEQRQAQAK